ncbi:MAG TPA: aminopeptidase P family protein [Paludibacter sp.]|nr:aminopeptidase P family protein [Paludibacter sp.]
MQKINNRLAHLRNLMRANKLSAYIVPGTDPHAGEYIADCWKERDWISGFDGSAGTVALTLEKAGVWVDSRYYLQADEQLKDTEYEVMKMGLPGVPDTLSWLVQQLKSGEQVGVNPEMFSVNAFAHMEETLGKQGVNVVQLDLIREIWLDRPGIPNHPIFVLDEKFSGKSSLKKMDELRKEMKNVQADVFITNTLDEIAWLFNIRGSDVDYNPVAIAYACVSQQEAILYVSAEKLTDEVRQYLKSQSITVKDYLAIYEDIASIPHNQKVLFDGNKLNRSLFESIPATCTTIPMLSPVAQMKSIKNETELAGFRKAMIKDGVALTRFFIWLEENVGSGKLTELSITDKLHDFRAEQEDFYGESFATITGYAGHGAIVHYKADEKSDATILPEGILLLDSGAQFLHGTTDITRTVTLGMPTKQQKTDFTLVLKGHIGLATAKFPIGTRGSQLDILARKAMWDRGLNYGHGTGHGIGHFLNVHEGPQSIRMEENPVTLQPGMIISNEPGLYRTNKYGVRTENLIHVVEDRQTEFGSFLKFETLTYFPIDTNLIDKDLLTTEELNWLNAYHQEVYDRIAPHLSHAERLWLQKKTKAI